MDNTTTIKGFCDFVNYLYANRKLFAENNNIVTKMQKITAERDMLQPKKYAEHQKQDETLQKQYRAYYSIIEENVNLPIKEKGRELAGLQFEYDDKNRLQGAISESIGMTRQDLESIAICIDRFFDFTSSVSVRMNGFYDIEQMVSEIYKELIFDNPFGIKIKQITKIKQKETYRNRYEGLAKKLNKFLINATDETLRIIIEHKRLPDNTEKPIWIKEAEAHRFKKWLNISEAPFNKMFDVRGKDGEIKSKGIVRSKEPENIELKGSVWEILKDIEK